MREVVFLNFLFSPSQSHIWYRVLSHELNPSDPSGFEKRGKNTNFPRSFLSFSLSPSLICEAGKPLSRAVQRDKICFQKYFRGIPPLLQCLS